MLLKYWWLISFQHIQDLKKALFYCKNQTLVNKRIFDLYQPAENISSAYLSSSVKKLGICQLLQLSGKYKTNWPIYLQTEQGQSISCCSADPYHRYCEWAVHYNMYKWPLIALMALLHVLPLRQHNYGINISKQHNYLNANIYELSLLARNCRCIMI